MAADGPTGATPRKLTYKEQLELKALPEKIEALESDLDAVQSRLADPDFYKGPAEDIASAQRELQTLEQTLNDHYGRWEELDQRPS